MTFDDDPGARAAALHEEAIGLRERGAYGEAEVACRQAVDIFRAAEGDQSPNLANALIEHGRLLELLDRLSDVGPPIEEALAILRPLVEGYDAVFTAEDDAVILDELLRLIIQAEIVRASTLRARGALDAAEQAFRKVLALVEARLPPDDPQLAAVLNDLGVVHKFQGRYDEAEPLYRRALAIAEAAGMSDDTATLAHNLGGLAHARGDFAAGEPLARRSVELREAQLGADHPTTAADRAAWGALLEGLGRTDEAERAYADALAVFETRLGPRSLETASALTALGGVQALRDAREDAERSYRRALDIREATLGPAHFDVAMTLNNLGMLLAESHPAEASALLTRACDIFRSALGADHPHTRAVAQNLATLSATAP